jgi:N-acetylmuramoyl-L-alanine amidase
LPKSQTKGIAGYYQYQYRIKESDNLMLSRFRFDLKKGNTILSTKTDSNIYTLFKDEEPVTGTINMLNTPVYTGLGEDRLGGTKAGFLDSGVAVQILAALIISLR